MNDASQKDRGYLAAAIALGGRGRGCTAPNPNVGCVIVAEGRIVGRGWTQPGGRPHAEAMALEQAGEKSRGATCYTSLEPCAHDSPRGPACADLLIAAGVARVVAALGDPDPRTDGRGHQRLRDAGILVETGLLAGEAAQSMAGFLTRRAKGRPYVTLKLATSLDGCIAMAGGSSRWITGPAARAHAHLERARHEAILVGRGTYEADAPHLDVRLPGLEGRSPRRIILSRHTARQDAPPAPPRRPSEGWGLLVAEPGNGAARDPSLRWGDGGRWGDGVEADDSGWQTIISPHDIAHLTTVDHLLVEGGAQTAAAFLAANLVDRLLLYRAPILIGGGTPALGDIGLVDLAAAHGRWRLHDSRMLGSDALEVYEAA